VSSVLYVDRVAGESNENLAKKKKRFVMKDRTSTHLTLQSEISVDYPIIHGHPVNAFAVGDAIVWLHIILRNSYQTDLVRYHDVSFIGEGCNPQNYEFKSAVEAYWQFCATKVVPHIESNTDAKVLNENSIAALGASPVRRVMIDGISPTMRWGLVATSVSIIGAFVQVEGGKVPKNSIPGLGTLRFIASLHIVAGHLQIFGRDYMTPVPFAEFGYTWVPWFMLLSAFVLSWSTINKEPRRESPVWYEFLRLRVRGIYPLYLAGLIATVISSTRHIPTKRYIIDLLLLQSWYPGWREQAIMPHTWFLSAITPCWMLHGWLFQRIERASTKIMLFYCSLVCFLPLLLFGVLECWWCGHQTNQYKSNLDVLVIMFKFHPLCYLPLYACGICFAHLSYRWKLLRSESVQEDRELGISVPSKRNGESDPFVNILVQYGCAIGAAGTFASFALARFYHFHGAKLAFRLGALLPWHALLLIGLAVGSPRDPVRRFFEIQSLQIFGNVSYAQYIFQFT
jgi:peptidoglycan/LPS O-acetylase OafA/YrhL